MDLPSGGSQGSVLSRVFNSKSTLQFTAHFRFSFLYFTFQCVLPVFIVDWTFSHLERLIGSISVLENGPRESHTRIPILTLYLVSLLVSVQQVYIYPATDCGQPLTNDLFLYPKIPHFSSLFYFLFTLIYTNCYIPYYFLLPHFSINIFLFHSIFQLQFHQTISISYTVTSISQNSMLVQVTVFLYLQMS